MANAMLLLLGLVALTGGAELLVRGASAIAGRFGMSSFFIGLTIVGFGTSTPELATSLRAAYTRLDDISMGNVIGSNIFNIAVILGITALISPIPVNTRVVREQVLIMIAVSALPFVVLFSDNVLMRWMGVVFVVGLLAFLYRGYRIDKPDAAEGALLEELETELGVAPASRWSGLWLSIGSVIAGLALLVLGAHFLVDSAIGIARAAGVSELVIGLTIVAAGTSMPELFTSLVAALRKQADISVGNIVGSNIFNILGIAGLTSVLYPQQVSPQLLAMDMPLMIGLSIACLPIMMSGHRISRTEGAVLLSAYVLYVIVLLKWAPGWFA